MLLIAASAGWTGLALARAPLFSSTGPLIAILDGKLLVGEATGQLGGWGTIALHSPSTGAVQLLLQWVSRLAERATAQVQVGQ